MGMAAPAVMETLKERARLLRDSMRRSQAITEEMVTILGSFDHRLSSLDAAMRPTLVRTRGMWKAHENIDMTIKSADVILDQFNLCRQVEAKINRGPHEDLNSFLDAIDQMRSCAEFFRSNKGFKSSDGVLNHANSVLASAISKLEAEFRLLISSYSKPMEPDHLFNCLPDSLQPSSGSAAQRGASSGQTPSTTNHSEHQYRGLETDVYRLPTLIPPRILPLLHALAEQLSQARRQLQCSKIYRESRGLALEQSLKKLGVEKFSKDDVQKMQWEVLEAKIGRWIHFIRIAVKLLFAGERKICDQIFEDIVPLREQCFAEVMSNSVHMLFGFVEAVAQTKRTPEKLSAFLDMYEIMWEVQPEIETIFEGNACSGIRESALSLIKRLAQTVQETFHVFKETVENDASKTIVADGRVHPLTSYVINYVKYLLDYRSVLRQVFLELGNGGKLSTQLETVTRQLIQALQSNLEGKSKQYKDPALSYIFLMNNIHYMVTSVRYSEAKELLGDDWVHEHRKVVQQHANQYKRVSWAKTLQTLSIQASSSSGGNNSVGSGGNSSGVSRETVKERFKLFNMQLEELHHRQSQWTIPDAELRESLRLMIAELLLPAYRSFVKRFGPLIENGRKAEKFMKYLPEDLEQMLGDFFESRTWSEQRR